MTQRQNEIPILASIAGLGGARKAWLCDVWGVLHNGVSVFHSAVEACMAFRRSGGVVILISNSPRPGIGVAAQIEELGVARGCYDSIVTSGDVTRDLVSERVSDPMFHIGPERDLGFFEGLSVQFTSEKEAKLIICTGLFDDETEKPEDYDGMLSQFAARKVPMICGNPDIVVERGDRIVPCAGALAVRYAAMGQNVIQAGKPYPPIYEVALKNLPAAISRADVLAIGDGIDTDIKGAAELGIDAVYIASRVHLQSFGHERLSARALDAIFENRPFRPVAALSQLNW